MPQQVKKVKPVASDMNEGHAGSLCSPGVGLKIVAQKNQFVRRHCQMPRRLQHQRCSWFADHDGVGSRLAENFEHPPEGTGFQVHPS